MNSYKKIIIPLVSLLTAIGILSLGIYIGYSNRPSIQKIANISGKETPVDIKADFSPFWQVWNILNEKYAFHSTSTENIEQKKVWGAIQGMTDSLGDEYTVFFPPEESKSFNEEISGSFSGVGMEVGLKDDQVTVVAPLKNSPAERVGMTPGDKVLEINGVSTKDMAVEKAVKLIRGTKGTTVKLLVSRASVKEPFIVSIVRDTIIAPTVDTEIKSDVFIIKLYNFSANSANLFRDALRKFVDSRLNRLIIDLRGNPGGYLDASINMASWFLPSGKVVVSEKFGEGKGENVHRSLGYDIFTKNLKLAILVNEGSASASEILAGALRDHGIATLIGEKTFGKGSVQELLPITGDTSLKVTIAKWYTPNGTSIDKNGLEPDIVVKRDSEDIKNLLDPQMDKAIEFLKNK